MTVVILGKMRYKFVVLLSFVLFIETLCNGVQGPPTEKRKKDEDHGSQEYISQVQNENGEEMSALKVVSAPDLSKERDRRKGDSKDEDTLDTADLSMLKQAKWIQKVVQEIGGFQYTIVSNDQEISGTIDDEDAPPPLDPLDPKPLTPEEEEAKKVYESAMALLNKTRPDKTKAYKLLAEASSKGSLDAKAMLAWAELFGNPLPQNLNGAKETFKLLAEYGHPDGHMGLGFLYATGFNMNVSQAKALVHYMIGALGGNTWAQMVLGYRYWSGITVPPSCERALDYYRLVANKGDCLLTLK